MITFLNFWALTGLLALSLPIAIHLIRMKRKIYQVPSILIFTGMKRTNPRRKIEDLLLLLLRCLIVALIALLLAHPLMISRISGPSDIFSEGDSLLVCLIDDTTGVSGYSFQHQKVFEHLKEHTIQALKTLPDDAKVVVAVTSTATLSRPMPPGESVKMIRALPLQNMAYDLQMVLLELARQLPNVSAGMRRTSLLVEIPPSQPVWSPISGNPVFPPNSWNIDWRELQADSLSPYLLDARWNMDHTMLEIRFRGPPARLAAMKIHLIRQNGTNTELELSPDHILAGQCSVSAQDLPAGEPFTVALSDSADTEASDSFSRYYVAPPRTTDKPLVLILHDGSAESRTGMLTLHAAFINMFSTAFDLQLWNYCDTESVEALKERPSCIVLPPLSKPGGEKLQEYLERAAATDISILIFPAADSARELYHFLPDEERPFWGAPIRLPENSGLTLSNSARFRRSFFALFSRGLSQITIDTICPIRINPGDQIIFSADRKPILVTRQLKSGARLFLWTIPFQPPPLSFLMNPLFPQLLGKLAFPKTAILQPDGFYAGDIVPLADQLPHPVLNGTLILTDPDGVESEISVSRLDRGEYSFTRPGLYRLREQGTRNEAQNIVFPVNELRGPSGWMDHKELLTRIGFTEKRLFQGTQLFTAPLKDSQRSGAGPSDTPEQIYDLVPVLAVLLTLCLAVEMILGAMAATRKAVVSS